MTVESVESGKSPGKLRQGKILGFTEVEDDAVEKLAIQYREQTDEWLAAQKPALETEKELQAAVLKNKKILEAAKKHPKGKVRVGKVVLTFPPPSDAPKIRVKILNEGQEED